MIEAVEARHPAGLPGALCFHWKWFGSEGMIHRTPGLVQDRFQHSASNQHVKSVVRLAEIRSMRWIHIPELLQPFVLNSALAPVGTLGSTLKLPEFSGGQLNHYFQKSFEEFGVKLSRGQATSAGGLTKRGVETFFLFDTPPNQAVHDPMPGLLRQRVEDELAGLQALPGMRQVTEDLEARYRVVSTLANGLGFQESCASLKARHRPLTA